MWPFKQAEKRAEGPYTDAITEAIINASADSQASGYVAALEVAAGAMSRAFASASVEGPNAGLFTPWVMAQIGRSLVEIGEAVWFRRGGMLVRGEQYGILPDGTFQFSLPTGQLSLPANRVLAARWNIDINSMRGIAPLQAARTLNTLQRQLEKALADESSAAIGYLLPLPADGDAANIAQLKKDLAGLKGQIAVIETPRNWQPGNATSPRDFQLSRMGPDYPESAVNLYEAAQRTVLAACGYPVQLIGTADGTSQREAWRRYLHGTVAPMGRLVVEAAQRAGLRITLDFDNLFASDISGRARAFQSLVGGGMDISQAAALSGLLNED